nr:MAG TPA: hypothetical protein [Caudoviricetes sp.]
MHKNGLTSIQFRITSKARASGLFAFRPAYQLIETEVAPRRFSSATISPTSASTNARGCSIGVASSAAASFGNSTALSLASVCELGNVAFV